MCRNQCRTTKEAERTTVGVLQAGDRRRKRRSASSCEQKERERRRTGNKIWHLRVGIAGDYENGACGFNFYDPLSIDDAMAFDINSEDCTVCL